jgi:hypothetical protein
MPTGMADRWAFRAYSDGVMMEKYASWLIDGCVKILDNCTVNDPVIHYEPAFARDWVTSRGD